jgi:cell volume regulation protein A
MVGAIVGGSSSIIIIPTMQIGKVKEEIGNLVTIESAVTDAMCVVFASIFIKALLLSGDGVQAAAGDNGAVLLLENVGFGLLAGGLAGFFWIVILPWIPASYSYLITLSALFGFYVLVQKIGGSSALAVLIFAVIVGNAGILGRLIKLEGRRCLGEDVDKIHVQLSFVVKVFFFVIVGTLLRPPFLPMLVGVFIALVLIGVRPLGVKIGMFKSPLLPADLKLVNICAPRGLAAGVLATIPFTQGVTGVEQLSTTVFAVIVTTIVVFAVLFAKLQNEIPAALTPSVEKES